MESVSKSTFGGQYTVQGRIHQPSIAKGQSSIDWTCTCTCIPTDIENKHEDTRNEDNISCKEVTNDSEGYIDGSFQVLFGPHEYTDYRANKRGKVKFSAFFLLAIDFTDQFRFLRNCPPTPPLRQH